MTARRTGVGHRIYLAWPLPFLNFLLSFLGLFRAQNLLTNSVAKARRFGLNLLMGFRLQDWVRVRRILSGCRSNRGLSPTSSATWRIGFDPPLKRGPPLFALSASGGQSRGELRRALIPSRRLSLSRVGGEVLSQPVMTLLLPQANRALGIRPPGAQCWGCRWVPGGAEDAGAAKPIGGPRGTSKGLAAMVILYTT